VRAAISTAVFGIVVVLLAVVLSIAGLVLVRRLTPLSVPREHNEVAGFIYAVLGIAYAVLLAFLVIAVWERFEAARDAAEHEGNELAEIYWLADTFPDSKRQEVQDLAHSYAQVVIDEEWPMMADAQASPHAWTLMDQLRESIQNLEVSTSAEQVLYDQGLTRVNDMQDARRLRLLDANTYVPTILWIVLISGGVITVGFTYLFGLEKSWVHMLMVGALAVIIASALFTIYALEYPFAGEPRVTPDALELDLQRFEGSLK
jgi:cytochrome b subunit of formate dehydrogenase